MDGSLADMTMRALMGAGGYGLACMTGETRGFVMCHCKVEVGRWGGGGVKKKVGWWETVEEEKRPCREIPPKA